MVVNNMSRKKKRDFEAFHKRFDIDVNLVESQRRFVNRVKNTIYIKFFAAMETLDIKLNEFALIMAIANQFGEKIHQEVGISYYTKDDFHKTLQAIEILYSFVEGENELSEDKSGPMMLNMMISNILSRSETELGIRWDSGHFYPSGAKELDEALVNQNLKWLRSSNLTSALAPYEKALQHFLKSKENSELLQDVITGLHESLEAVAKHVTGRKSKDLSANRELFIRNLGVSNRYSIILKEYIAYANYFRHAEDKSKSRKIPDRREVESFIYLTGIFLRLASTASDTKRHCLTSALYA